MPFGPLRHPSCVMHLRSTVGPCRPVCTSKMLHAGCCLHVWAKGVIADKGREGEGGRGGELHEKRGQVAEMWVIYRREDVYTKDRPVLPMPLVAS